MAVDCPDQDGLVALLTEDDPPSEVRAHVLSCPQCRQAVARLQGVLEVAAFMAGGALASADRTTMPADMSERLNA